MKHIPLVFENDYAMVLIKPAGLSVQGGEGVNVSLDSLLSHQYKPRPLLVHRLDKDSSGLILVAKTKEAAAAFSVLFSGGEPFRAPADGRGIRKQYLAVCAGSPPEEGVISLSLDVRGKKRESHTSYRRLALVEDVSLLELTLGTGRMHQIRRHLMLISHPILGDDKYGDFALNRRLRRERGLKKLLLHAFHLVLPPLPPFLPQGLELRAPPPEYFSPYIPGRFQNLLF
jgi:23S rRNA pseudouridine955/2504/2580 synthase